MSALSIIGGVSLIVAAFAFHFRARLLGSQAEGWPAAPYAVRWAIETVSMALLIAGFCQATLGYMPALVLTALAVALAGYAVVLALNIGRQRRRDEAA